MKLLLTRQKKHSGNPSRRRKRVCAGPGGDDNIMSGIQGSSPRQGSVAKVLCAERKKMRKANSKFVQN